MRNTHEQSDQFTLPGFVDIIFLLLIFSMATMSFTSGQESVRTPGNERFLPVVPKATSERPAEYLMNLLIIISYRHPDSFKTSNPDSSRELIILQPPAVGQPPVTIDEALKAARDAGEVHTIPKPELLLALSDKAFKQSPTCQNITNTIDHYAQGLIENVPGNTIEIRAVKETEFRLINFIITQACRDGNTIPRIVLHTLAG